MVGFFIGGYHLKHFIPFSVIDPIPTYPFDPHQRMDCHHIRTLEDHFPTVHRQTRPNLHVFARYPRGIYFQWGISCIHSRTASETGFGNVHL